MNKKLQSAESLQFARHQQAMDEADTWWANVYNIMEELGCSEEWAGQVLEERIRTFDDY